MLFWTRHANFRRVEMTFMTTRPKINNPLNSDNILDASSQLATRSTPRRVKFYKNIVAYFGKAHLNLATRTRQKCNYDPNGLPYK